MSFSIGDTIGPYKIVSHVGQGGMATIYKAYQTTLDRYVALKIIHPALKEDHSFVMRLQREATVIAKLNHPNIVAVHDFREHEGIPFLVLQFIDGKTLKDVLKEQKPNKQQILNIIRPVADALTYAHSRNVLHRDVKPSNILIDKEGHVYLSDFGLARIAQSGESTASQDMMIGSPHYLSPEQAKSEPVDARTDVYSLGIILYEMFVGRVPFSAETAYATILAQINEPPPPPRSLNPKVPIAVEQVLLKALAKNSKDRYAGVAEMMRALENAVRGPREEDDPAAPIQVVDYKPGIVVPVPAASVPTPAARVEPAPREVPRLYTYIDGKVNGEVPPVASAPRLVAKKKGTSKEAQRPRKGGSWLPAVVGLLTLLALVGCILFSTIVLPRMFPPAVTPVVLLTTPTRVFAVVPSATSAIAVPTAMSGQLPTSVLSATRAPSVTSVPSFAALRGKLAYSMVTGDMPESRSVFLADGDGSDAHPVIEFALWPSISPDGLRIAYYRMKDEGLYVANIDGGAARKIAPGEVCCAQWSPDGKRIMYLQGKLKSGDVKIVLINPDGTGKTELVTGFSPGWSPDGNRIAYSACEANTTQCGLWTYDIRTGKATMITRDDGKTPRWAPRGDKIVYPADSGQGHINLFIVNSDGTAKTQLTSGKGKIVQPAWSLDGSFIYYRSDQDGRVWGIFVMRADGSAPRLLINSTPPDGERWPYETLSVGP